MGHRSTAPASYRICKLSLVFGFSIMWDGACHREGAELVHMSQPAQSVPPKADIKLFQPLSKYLLTLGRYFNIC